MNRKNVGIAFGALCGLAALTATAAEIFYDISINTKSPIHMSKLNNLVQKATNTAGNEEEASAKYSGMTGTPEIKEWMLHTARMCIFCLIRCACTENGSKIPAQNMFSYATATQARPSIWPDLFINFIRLVIMFWQ